MSHALSPITGHPGLFLDESFVDGSCFIRDRALIEETFQDGWEADLCPSVMLADAERAAFRSHFTARSGALVCTQCRASFSGPRRRREALRHMRANLYQLCPVERGQTPREGGSDARETT